MWARTHASGRVMGRGDGNVKKDAAKLGTADIPHIVKELKTASQEVKELKVHMLDVLASKSPENPPAMVKAGAIGALVGLVASGTEGGQVHAASTLATIATVTKDYKAIVAAGAIKPLVTLLRMGSQQAQTYAAAAIASISEDPTNKSPIISAGAIAPLVRLVRSSVSADAQVHASDAIANLSSNHPPAQNAFNEAGAIPLLLALLESGKAQVSAANALTHLLSPGLGVEPEPPDILMANPAVQEAVAAEGGIPPLLSLLNGMNTAGKVNAAAALSNLARGNESTQNLIVKAGGIGPLLQMLPRHAGTSVAQAQAQAASALAQLARFNRDNQDLIARAGGLPLMVTLLGGENGYDVQAMAALAVTELCRDNLDNQTMASEQGSISSLVAQLRGNPHAKETKAIEAVQAEAVGAIWVLCENHFENKIAIASSGGISPTVNLLASGGIRAQSHAANALASLGFDNTHNQEQITALLVSMLDVGTPEAKSNAAASLWRLVQENPKSQEVVAKAGPITDLITLLKEGTDKAKAYAFPRDRSVTALLQTHSRLFLCQVCALWPLSLQTH